MLPSSKLNLHEQLLIILDIRLKCRRGKGFEPLLMNVKFGFLGSTSPKIAVEHDLWSLFEQKADVKNEKLLGRLFSHYSGGSNLIEVIKSGFCGETWHELSRIILTLRILSRVKLSEGDMKDTKIEFYDQ